MKTQSILLAALAAAPSAFAHTVFSTFYVDGVSQGDGVAMRMRRDPAKASYPLDPDKYATSDMACNVDGTTGVSRVQPVNDGSTLTFEMRSWPDDPSKPSLDVGHKGPCAVYLKKVASAIDDPAAGDGWFKLFDDGYDASTDEWCTDRLIKNNGRLSIKLPTGLQGGYYLARPEVLALHNATEGDGQFYTGCAQIFLKSSGDLVPKATVSIPGYVTAGEPSVKFNIYINKNSEYKVPGPSVATFTSGASTASSQTTQTEGVKNASCICENANWCGTEVPSYTDETGCWAAGEACWNQNKACYASAPATGSAGCKIWEAKCTAIQEACKAKNFNGPPNKGEDLTPKASTISVGLVMSTVGGGVDSTTPQTSSSAAGASSTAEAKTTDSAPPAYTSTTKASEPASEPTAAASPAASSSTFYGWYSGTDTTAIPTSTSSCSSSATVPASEQAAPEPTKAAVCPEGYECVTKYHTQTVTQMEYVTVDVYERRRRSMHERRHGHRF